MCLMFSGQNPENYTYHTRSIRLGGHGTSIRLEAAFWTILEEIAAMDGLTLAKFLTKLHDEVLEFQGEATNFTSLLRCACLTYVSEVRAHPERRHDAPIIARTDVPPALRLSN
ncbi:MAG: ribbon-helix-helix domain-containing protein [Beijerinckiaceae bacterium]